MAVVGLDAKDPFDDFEETLTPEERDIFQPTRARGKSASIADPMELARQQWATAGLCAMGFVMALAALFLGVREAWQDFPSLLRAGILGVILAVTYALAILARRVRNRVMARFFFTEGALLFGAALALLSVDAPTDMAAQDFFLNFIDATGTIVATWTLGVFFLAMATTFRTLHYLASLLVVAWLSTHSGGTCASTALIICALGEYWAWARKSVSVAIIYLALCGWTVASQPYLWFHLGMIIPAGLTCATTLYWFGVSFKNAIMRGFALALAGVCLAATTFPAYWHWALSDEMIARVGVRMPSVLGSIAFVLFCAHTTFTGARGSTVRFLYGLILTLAWTILQAFKAHHTVGSRGAAMVMAFAAALVFFLLFVERHLRSLPQFHEALYAGRDHMLTDANSDDPEQDDMFDAQARENAKLGPIFAITLFYQQFLSNVVKSLREPFIVMTVALQFYLLIVEAMK
ncbi:MAG: hypothetical protein Q4G03_11560 [Planctomycetia bacterium]|nr:hypothetical protein [Planctomycetia bacterium]